MVKKNIVKKNALFMAMFVIGMLTVSVANFFGGYYCVVLAPVAILATVYTFNVLENNELNENKYELLMVGVLILFEFIFFVVNDIIGYPVYVRGNTGLMDVTVMGVQVYSVAVTIYSLIKLVLIFCWKDKVELVDGENKIDGSLDNNQEEIYFEKDTINSEENANNNKEKEIKRITQFGVKKDVPFMEEEK